MTEDTGLPSTQRLLELVDAMVDQPVVMLVDMVADRFVTGTPKRISREAPVLILRRDNEILVPGGGANAVANVDALGGRPLPLGVVGDDTNGRSLIDLFAERGIATRGIAVRAGFSTPTKVRILGGSRHGIKQQIVRYDIEDFLELGPDESSTFEEALAAWQGQARAAVLSDYGYGSVQPEMAATLRAALAPGGQVLCDSRYRLADFHGIDGATPNAEEAEALLDHDLNGDLDAAGNELRCKLDCSTLLVTRGSSGMSLFRDGAAAHLPVHGTTQVADVTGAGDTVIGTFALATAAGATPLEAALLANYAGGVVVMKMGTATLDRAELAAAISEDPGLLERVSWASS
ncbi:MAG: PfkB family carbohydrate kinase [Acidobacteria bacterium]|nr:PfkB family carbohydrate kinase [Acidobacteriota bacterium]